MNSNRGFTLLEMSIVLIIIGLMVGGIIVGRDLIKNAELQGVIADVNKYKNAAKLFRDKYTFLPGDIPNALTFWGEDGGSGACVATGGDTSTPWAAKVATCNGDGNGRIMVAGTTPNPVSHGVGVSYESLRVWQHLANAGFIDGLYSGVGYGASVEYKPGINVPASDASSANGFLFFFSYPINGSQADITGVTIDTVYPSNYGHIIEFGAVNDESIAGGGDYGAITSIGALNIDTKMDDGAPHTGNVLSYTDVSNVPDCNRNPTTYYVAGTGNICALIFLTGL